MSLALSFISVSCLFWGIISLLFNGPFLLVRPAPFEVVAAYKRVEYILYFVCAFGIPSLTVLVHRAYEHWTGRSASSNPNMEPVHQPSFSWVWWWIVPLAFFIFTPRQGMHGSILHMDEGLRLGAANQNLHGKKLYKDIYLLYGPGIDVWQPLAAFKVFGKTIAATRTIDWIVEPLGVLALYWLALGVLRKRLAVVFLLLVIAARIPPFWVTPRAALTLAALLSFISSLQAEAPDRQRRRSFYAGLLTAAAFLYSKEAGFIPPLTIAAFLLIRLLRNLTQRRPYEADLFRGAAYLLGIAGVMVPFLAWLATFGALRDFFENSFLVSSSVLSAWGKPTPPLANTLSSFAHNPLSLFGYTNAPHRWWFPVLLYMAALTLGLDRLWRARKGKTETDPVLLVLSLAGLFFFIIAMGRSDYDHWLKATPVFWVLIVVLIERCGDFVRAYPNDWRPQSVGLLLALLLAKAAWGFGNLSSLWYTLSHPSPWPVPSRRAEASVLSRLGNVNMPASDRDPLAAVVTKLQHYSAGNRPVWIFADEADYYFLADVVNPTRYANVTFIFTEGMVNEVLGDLERTPPACILAIDKGGTPEHGPDHERLARWVLEHYRIAERAEGHLFYVPRKEPLPTPR